MYIITVTEGKLEGGLSWLKLKPRRAPYGTYVKRAGLATPVPPVITP